ncbi:MAG: hypothetical protein J6T00_02510 [Bacteroidaceae bacterium]|nr:hypothetical protein [Bacteroidaceae bacterium]
MSKKKYIQPEFMEFQSVIMLSMICDSPILPFGDADSDEGEDPSEAD